MDGREEDQHEALAEALWTAVRGHRPGARVESPAGLSLEAAYDVQRRLLDRHKAAGDGIVGWKVGCTSAAVQGQFGLSQPIAGRLLASGIHRSGEELDAGRYVECAVEAELVLRLKADLSGDADATEAAAAIGTLAAGIELHHYRFWFGAPSSQELIASNGLHAGLVMGKESPFVASLDLAMEGVGLWVNGVLKASALNAEILGAGPLTSLCWLAREAARRGERLRAGEIVIPGSAVRLVRVGAGDRIEARFSRLGECRVSLQ